MNGALSGTATLSYASINGTGIPYKIGSCWDAGVTSYVTGEIGEVSIYGFPLNSTQILANYNNTRATYGV